MSETPDPPSPGMPWPLWDSVNPCPATPPPLLPPAESHHFPLVHHLLP